MLAGIAVPPANVRIFLQKIRQKNAARAVHVNLTPIAALLILKTQCKERLKQKRPRSDDDAFPSRR
jgi:hypothetical protein